MLEQFPYFKSRYYSSYPKDICHILKPHIRKNEILLDRSLTEAPHKQSSQKCSYLKLLLNLCFSMNS